MIPPTRQRRRVTGARSSCYGPDVAGPGLKVVDVAEFYAEQGGGVKTYVDHKLRYGERNGHQVVVIAPSDRDGEERRHGGRVIWVRNPPVPGDPRYRLYVREKAVHRILTRERPDVVEGSSVYGGGWFAARWKGPAARSLVFHQDPVAVFGHSVFDRVVPRPWIDRASFPAWSYLRTLANRFSTTVVAGSWLQSRLAGFGVPRVVAIPFGIDAEPFRQAEPDPRLRSELLARAGLPPSARLLLGISRHHPEKRIPTLIRAVAELNRAFPVGLVLYGDGPIRSQIDALAAQHPYVVIAGHTRNRKELARAVATADAFVHGSSAETYGLVVAEAIQAGVPVVVPHTGGAADLADPAYSETYPAGDASACAAAVRRLFSRPDGPMRAACRAATIRTLDQHFHELFAHYGQLSGGDRVWRQRHTVAPTPR